MKKFFKSRKKAMGSIALKVFPVIILLFVVQISFAATTITVSKTSLSFGNNASSQTFTVNTNVTCSVSSNNSYFVVTPTSVPANTCYTITVSASVNNGSFIRTGTITVKGGGVTKYVTITQAGNSCITQMYWYSQIGWPGHIGNCINSTFSGSGCAVTCGAILLTSEVSNPSNFTPVELNNYLTSHNLYTNECDLYLPIVADVDGPGGLVFCSSTTTVNDWTWLDNQLANCRKVVVSIPSSTPGKNHFVIVRKKEGASGVSSSYKCINPGRANVSDAIVTLANLNSPVLKGFSFSGTWAGNRGGGDSEYLSNGEAIDASTFENKIYPNPINIAEVLNFEVESSEQQNVLVRVLDISGRIISEETKSFNEGLNIGTITTPVNSEFYFVSFNFSDNSIITKKLFVQ